MNPVATADGPRSDARRVPIRGERVYVWDLVVRASHWLIALSIVVLSVTGYYIGDPFGTTHGAGTGGFTMAWFKAVHFYAAVVFTAAVVARLIWMFSGPPTARWRQFVPVDRERRRAMWGTFLFYVMARPKPPPATGHNPLAGATYVAVFGLYLVVIVSGLALYSIDADLGSVLGAFGFLLALFDGPQNARWVHHVVMWLLLGFTVHHIFSALLVSIAERNGTLDSIFSGYKYITEEEPGSNGRSQDE